MKRKERRFAAVLSLVIVAIPLVAFMTWSGAPEEIHLPPPTVASPSFIPTNTPEEEPEEPEYIPDAAEVEALAKMQKKTLYLAGEITGDQF